jgi:hypothetical protein
MQRISKWGGLVTQASPYAIPPGGATQQVNFALTKPGQLTSRGGMREMNAVAADQGAGLVEQMWVISGGVGNPDRIITLNDSGEVTIIGGVA